MRLLARIKVLEQGLPEEPRPCPYCGSIDREGNGRFYGGTTVHNIAPSVGIVFRFHRNRKL